MDKRLEELSDHTTRHIRSSLPNNRSPITEPHGLTDLGLRITWAGSRMLPFSKTSTGERNMGRSNREASYSRFTIYRFPPFGKKKDRRPARVNQSSF